MGPRGEVSLDLALGKNLGPGPDHVQSRMTRKEIPSLVQDPSPRDRSPALGLRSGQNLDQDPSREEISGPPQDPVVRIERQRKLAVALSRVQDPNHRQQMGINPSPGPDHTQRLLRKWNKMAENQSPQKTETIKKILSFFEIKINVLLSASIAIAFFFQPNFFP